MTSSTPIQDSLGRYFGFQEFRPGQREIIESVLEGRDALGVMPTGGGKSLCYQLPALMQEGVTLVVSPLIALMKDQVDQLTAQGHPVTSINSSLSQQEQRQRMQAVKEGKVSLMYVAPERFRNPWFNENIRNVPIRLLAIDEAHCISHWGHDFRPDYRRLAEAAESLGRPPLLALTATATPEVQRDIQQQLRMRDPFCQVTGFNRPNLHLETFSVRKRKDKDLRLLELLQGEPGSTIIYAGTRKAVDELMDLFRFMKIPNAVAYHAGLPDETRHTAQDKFLSGQARIIVATNAFGMGIDKKDIRRVVHYSFPGTLEAYYQEIGRAGRDGLPSVCSLLFSYQDRYLLEFFIDGKFPARESYQAVHALLKSFGKNPVHLTQEQIRERLDVNINDMGISSILRQFRFHGIIKDEKTEPPLEIELKRPIASIVHSVKSNTIQAGLAHQLSQYDCRSNIIKVPLYQLCKDTGLSGDQVKRGLGALDDKGFLKAVARTHIRRDLSLTRPEASFSELEIDFSLQESKRKMEYEKLETIIRFADTPRCRHRFILDYFGERSGDDTCSACDNCRCRKESIPPRPVRQEDLTVMKKILSGLARMNGSYGIHLVAQMLKGSKDKKLVGMGFDRLSTYGLLQEFSIEHIKQMINAMHSIGLCAREEKSFSNQGFEQRYQAVSLTERGQQVMQGEETLSQLPATWPGSSGNKDSESGKKKPRADDVSDLDPDLLKELRSLRRRLADKEQKPAFFVFADSVLHSMAREQPQTADDLLQIKGMGPKKMASYGHHFLKAIQNFRSDRSSASTR